MPEYYGSSNVVQNSSTNQVFLQPDPSFWLATLVPTSVVIVSSASGGVWVKKMSQFQWSRQFTVVEVLHEFARDSDSGAELFFLLVQKFCKVFWIMLDL